MDDTLAQGLRDAARIIDDGLTACALILKVAWLDTDQEWRSVEDLLAAAGVYRSDKDTPNRRLAMLAQMAAFTSREMSEAVERAKERGELE